MLAAQTRDAAPLQGCPVQVLTFDFHNTLANCDPWFELEIGDLPWAVVTELGLPLPASEKPRVDGAYRNLRQDVIASGVEVDAYAAVTLILESFGYDPPSGAVVRAIDGLMYQAINATVPVAGAVETVRQLHAAGTRLGVVSSAVHHRTLEWILERLGIATCFAQVITSASSGHYKSTPAIFESALQLLGGTAGSSVHVGDSLRWDVATAQQAGMTAVWLETQRRDRFASTPITVTPDLTLQSLEGATPALLGLLERIRVPIDA